MRHSRTALLLVFPLMPTTATADFSGYRQQLFQPLPPSLLGDGQAGFHNPSTTALGSGASVEIAAPVTERERAGTPRFGVFTRLGNLGFGLVQKDDPQQGRVNDYRLGLGMGNEVFALGFGWGWASRGPETHHWKGGLTWRSSRFFSLGATYTELTRGSGNETVAEVGIRPLGTSLLTLFADFSNGKGNGRSENTWSAGALVRVTPWAGTFARYSWNDKGSAILAGIQLGGESNLSSYGGTSSLQSGRSQNLPLVVSARFGTEGRADQEVSAFQLSYARLKLQRLPSYRQSAVLSRLLEDEASPTLWETLEALEKVRTSNAYRGLFLEVRAPFKDLATIWELHDKLLEIRKSGKHVVVYLESATMASYLLASAADKIIMAPYTNVTLPGFALSRTYAHAMLAKLGIGVQELRFLKYKSALETTSRESMSEGEREQSQRLMDSFLESWKNEVAAARPQAAKALEETLASPAHDTPEALKSLGLVDVVGTTDSFFTVAKDLEKEEPRLVDLPGAESPRGNDDWGPHPRVALVYAVGECAMDEGIKARKLAKQIYRLAKDEGVSALVLRVDSPGGDPLAADVVNQALGEFRSRRKAPVIISQGRYAASGGYWLALDSDVIYSSPFTITGSIGVIGGWFYNNGAGDKLGLKPETVKTGKHADLTNGLAFPFLGEFLPLRKLDKDEEEAAYKSMRVVYDDFLNKVSQFRKKPKDQIEKVAQGRVWSGADAIKGSLVDKLGGLDAAIDEAVERTGLSRERVSIEEYPESDPWDFSGLGSVAAGTSLGAKGIARELVPSSVRFRMSRNGAPLTVLPLEYGWSENQEW